MANEKRLIDFEKAHKSVIEILAGKVTAVTAIKVSSAMKEATVDAVEVVRCKDCKHNEDCINRIQFCGRNPVLELNTTEYHPLSFCSYGERRDDG